MENMEGAPAAAAAAVAAPAAAAAAAAPAAPLAPLSALEDFELLTTDEVFARLMTEVTEGRFCGCHVLEQLRVSSRDVLDEHGPAMATGEGWLKLVSENTRLGMLALDLTKRATSSQQQLELRCKKWCRVLFAAAALVNQWTPVVPLPHPRQDTSMMLWVTRVMRSPRYCPKLLRLELLRFADMWDSEALAKDEELCRATAMGVILNLPNLTPAHLAPRDRKGLLGPLWKVLSDLHNAECLPRLARMATAGFQALDVNEWACALAHLVLVMGQTSFRMVRMWRQGMLSLRATIDEFEKLLAVLRLLVTDPKYQELCESPGMCQIAAGAVAAAAHCIVRIPDDASSAAVKDDNFQKLLSLLDDLFMYLASHETTGAVRQELRLNQGRRLARVDARMKEFGYPVLFVPKPAPKPTKAPPKEFLDSRTKKLMENPVRINATGAVVDHTTLVVMLLVDDEDSDLAFTPLPELQLAIQTWRDGLAGGGAEKDAEEQDPGTDEDDDQEDEDGPELMEVE